LIGWLLGGVTAWLGVSSRHHRQRREQLLSEKKLSAKP
jgi:putative membrane protein